jgi:hypothetical protein
MRKRSAVTKGIGGIVILFFILALLQAAVIRPWYLSWGATPAEVSEPLPGDSLIPSPSEVTTRAITIHAPADFVWPWLSQIGEERGGFYSYSWMENIFGADMNNADSILPEEEHIKPGDRVSYLRDGPPGTYTKAVTVVENRELSLEGWSFYLRPVDGETTRLIVRYSYSLPTAFDRAYYFLNFEMQHFIMESGMMRGIKMRAENAYQASK